MVGLGNVDNISDVNKPVSTATQTALDLKANLASPTFTGTPTLPIGTVAVTQTAGDDSTKIATTAFVSNAVSAATTGSFVDLSTNQTIAGTKTFSSDIFVKLIRIGNGKFNTGSNLAIGEKALINTTGGGNNTAIGLRSSEIMTSAVNNTSVGYAALAKLDTANANTAIGVQALLNSNGDNNTAVGNNAGDAITTGTNNTFLGENADAGSATLTNATAIGYQSSVTTSNTIQLGNTNVTDVKTSGTLTAGTVTYPKTHGTSGQVLSTTGSGTLSWTTPSTTATAYSGVLPIANGGTGASTQNFVDLTTNQTIAGNKTFSAASIGIQLNTNSSGSKIMKIGFANNGGSNNNSFQSLAFGIDALKSLSYGDNEIAIGYQALYNDQRGTNNIAIGNNSMYNVSSNGITWAQNNLAVGSSAGYNLTIGKHNVLLGNQSAYSLTEGNYNTIIGPDYSGNGITTGSNNTIIGRALSLSPEITNNIILANGSATIGAQFDGTNWKMTGQLETTGFKTATGTSSQYLMADGSVSAGAAAVREVADEFTATAAQTSFTLTQTPFVNSKVKMYINGIRISKTAYSVSGSTLTYVPENNGSYTLTAGDRIQMDFYY
ncbi:MAG: hypothetical protein B7Y83_04270 [Flavobacteriales bacterium 32-34-25]|nr:MAG: hypothetical protein B7Y83_04270 [Flavobacteriales bacterium 32-34-25]